MSGATTNVSTDPAAYAHTHAGTCSHPTANGDANTTALADADPSADYATNARADAWAHFGTHCCTYAVSSMRAGALVYQSSGGATGARRGR